MKKEYNGSLLLWSIFLMAILISSFLFISIKIQNKISQNAFFLSPQNKNESSIDVYFPNEDGMSIKSNEEIKFSFSGSTNTGTLTLLVWWPLEYTITWSTSTWGYIQNIPKTLPFQSGDILIIKNLWGMTKFTLNFSDHRWVIYPYVYEKVKYQIGSQFVVGGSRRVNDYIVERWE